MATKEDTIKSNWAKARKMSQTMGVFKTAIESRTNAEGEKNTVSTDTQSAQSTARSNESAPLPTPSSGKWKNLQTKLLLNAELRAPTIQLNGQTDAVGPPRLDLPPSRPMSARSNLSMGKSSRSNSYSSRPSSRLSNRPSSAYVMPPPKPPVKEKFINLKDRFDINMEELEHVGVEKMNSFKYIHIFFKVWEPQLCKSYRPTAVYTPPPRRTRSRKHRYRGGLASFLALEHLSRKPSVSSMKSHGSND